MADLLSMVMDLFSTEEPPEVLGHRIQKSLQVILAGLDERDALSGEDTETLRRELRMLLELKRIQIAAAEMDKAELVLQYMLRPGDLEPLRRRRRTRVEGALRPLGAGCRTPSAAGGTGHHARPVPRNMYRDTPEMYACDARCRDLVKRGLRVGAGASLRPIERVFLCLVLTHSEMLDDQHLCMAEWELAMAELAPDDPLKAFYEIFHRHVAVIQRFGRFPHRNKILQRTDTEAEQDFLNNSTFRFDLPLLRGPDGAFVFAGTLKKRTVTLLDHEYQTPSGRRRSAARRVRVQVPRPRSATAPAGRDHDRAQRVHHLAVEAGRADHLVPGTRRPQLRRDPARAGRTATLGEASRGDAGELAARGRTPWCCPSSRTEAERLFATNISRL